MVYSENIRYRARSIGRVLTAAEHSMVRPRLFERLSLIHMLAAFPVLDAIVNQLFAPGRLGSGLALSFLQIYRGVLLIILLSAIVIKLLVRPRVDSSVLKTTGVLALCLCVFSAKELIGTGSIAGGSVVAYLQITYWIILWVLVSISCKTVSEARIILSGLVIGAIISAGSVLIYSVLEMNITDAYHGIRATAGGFHSNKGLVGILIVGGYLCVYLARFTFQISALLAATICFAAVFATYNRSGMLALVFGLVWLTHWFLRHGRYQIGNIWARRLVILFVVLVATGGVGIGVSDMIARWGDMSNVDTAGSGRLINWLISLQWWVDADWPSKMLGIGHSGMMTIILAVKGRAIHTHSDFFDFLVMGGMIGILGITYLYRSVWRVRLRIHRSRPEYALTSMIVIAFITTSLVTGQLMQPAVMTAYILAIVCLPVAAGQSKGARRRLALSADVAS